MTTGGFARKDGGGGSANRGAPLRQAGETGKGLFISTPDADVSWHLRGVEREVAEGAVAAMLEYIGAGNNNKLSLTWPTDFRFDRRHFTPEEINTARIVHRQYADPVDEVKAYADFSGVRATSRRDGTEGNGETLTVNYGHPATPTVQSYARIPFKRGLTADDGEFLQITSPGGGEAASGESRFQSNRKITYTYFQEGEDGNDFRIRYRLGKASSGGGSVTAEYDSETQLTITVLFPSGSTGLAYSVNLSDIISAVNNARWSSTQLVTASLPSGISDGLVGFVAPRNPGVGDSLTPNNPSAARTDLVLSGGVGYTGLSSNIGEVRVSKTGARVAGAKSKATLDASPSSTVNGIVITAKEEGAALNSTPIGIRFQSVAVPSNSVAIIGQSGRLQLAVNGTVTMQAIVDKVNAAQANTFASQFTASLAPGQSGSTQVTWASGDSANTANTSGGADAVNPLEAIWDGDDHRLVIRAIETDTLADIRSAIQALPEFDSSSFALVRALTTDTIELPSAIGQFADYEFGGGADATHRSPISFSESNTALVVNGIIAGDTVKNVLDRYALASLEFFTLSVRPNFTNSSVFAVFNDSTVNFAHGVDEVARKLPVVTPTAAGSVMTYTVQYHGGSTSQSQRTTLNEMKTAWDDMTVPAGSDRPTSAITGSGSARISGVSSAPTGGENPVAPSAIEALVRPDDEVNGPNVEVRYHPSLDSLQDILDALIAQGAVQVEEIYGTDLDEQPEATGFERAMYPQVGTTVVEGDAQPFNLTDQKVLDLAKRTRTSSDRGKFLGTSKTDENDVVLLDAPDGSGNENGGGGEDNVQSDWNESDTNSDAYIKNKPTIPTVPARAGAFTSADEAKLDGIARGAEVNVKADWNESDTSSDKYIENKPSLGSSASRNVGGANGVAGLNSQGTLFSNYFPSYIATDAEVTAAVEALKGGAPTNMDTLKELADAIGLRLNDRGNYGSTSTYVARDVVRHTAPGEAHYIALQNVPAGKTPGVASDWKSYWYRIGFADGAPSSHVGTPTLNDGVLTITDRSGTPHSITLSSGVDSDVDLVRIGSATRLSANADTATNIGPISNYPDSFVVEFDNSGVGNNNTNRLEVYLVRKSEVMETGGMSLTFGGQAANYVRLDVNNGNLRYLRHGVPNSTELGIFRMVAPKGDKGDKGDPGNLEEVGSANYSVQTNRYRVGDIDKGDIEDGTVLAVRLDDPDIGPELHWLLGEDINDGVTDNGVVANNTHFAKVPVSGSSTAGLFLGWTSAGKLAFASTVGTIDPAPLTLYKMGTTAAPERQLHISGFSSTRGNLSPVAGAIGTLSYGVEWSIAQSSHLGAARIVGFKGTAANPNSVAVLKTLASAEYAHGSGDVVIPGGVSLAAGETYTLRLEIYHENDDPATQLPRGYQDIRITAHAATAANYHVGYLLYRNYKMNKMRPAFIKLYFCLAVSTFTC